MPDVDINSMLVLPKLPKWLKKTVQKGVLVVIEKIIIFDWNIGFLNVIFSVFFCEFRMKYFKDIEILYEGLFIISNSNVDTVIISMNNI